MRITLFITTVLLAGCASQGGPDRFDAVLAHPWFDGSHRTHGSWLDQVGRRPHPPTPMSDAQALALSGRAARLQAQAEAIRVELARETERTVRVEHYRTLRRIGDELRPVERQLEDAGRASRATTIQPYAS